MTPSDIRADDQALCFWCQVKLAVYPNANYVTICDKLGSVIMIKRQGDTKPSPMVYCSSDCMVYESHLRYCDRVSRGVFRKNFSVEFGGDTYAYISPRKQMPSNWVEDESAKLIGQK